jgi:hypothetical protein
MQGLECFEPTLGQEGRNASLAKSHTRMLWMRQLRMKKELV